MLQNEVISFTLVMKKQLLNTTNKICCTRFSLSLSISHTHTHFLSHSLSYKRTSTLSRFPYFSTKAVLLFYISNLSLFISSLSSFLSCSPFSIYLLFQSPFCILYYLFSLLFFCLCLFHIY